MDEEESVNTHVINCARCGESHFLHFIPFHLPIIIERANLTFTHWALCPITYEPILFYIEEEQDE